jgi:poly(3-hydroxybutyrate) depolymerase
MVVSLHSWSGDLEQRKTTLERAVYQQGWIYLFPNFRGVNRTPAACGSKLAQQDILDAIDWVIARQQVDQRRIFLTGASGGGHMTMLMAGRYPDRWRAASAFVGISDLALWHAKHQGQRYGVMLEACCGGAPGDSAAVDAQYRQRSPLTYIAAAKDLAIDIAAGINDGHTGSVPIKHSIDAFNKIAAANQTPVISDRELAELSVRNGRLSSPTPADVGFDSTFNRKFYLRRMSGKARVTIFDGGHEGITTATMAWFTRHAAQ